jgi:hypothetical protein
MRSRGDFFRASTCHPLCGKMPLGRRKNAARSGGILGFSAASSHFS